MPEEKKPPTPQPEKQREEPSNKQNPLVFISHDTRDAKLAEAFSKLLASVSCGVLKAFRSSDKKGRQGIDYGVEWFPEIMTKLEKSSDVVCLLTRNSVDRPWILYEAGVAKGKLATPVYGVALGIPLSDATSGPFAQFQNCEDDDESLTSLVIQLLRRIPNAEPDREIVRSQVQAFKATAAELTAPPDGAAVVEDERVDDSTIAKLFEEVKVMFQELPSRVEGGIARSADSPKSRKRRRFHPMMFEHMMFGPMEEEGSVGFLVLAGLLRDDLPWMSEIMVEAYKAIRSGTQKELMELIRTVEELDRFTTRGPFMEELIDSRDMEMMVHEFPHMLHHGLERALERKKEASRRKR